MTLSSTLLTHAGWIKINLSSSAKIQLYILPDIAHPSSTKIKVLFEQQIAKGRQYQGIFNQLEKDVVCKPYLLKHQNSFRLLSQVEAHPYLLQAELIYFKQGSDDHTAKRYDSSLDCYQKGLIVARHLQNDEAEMMALLYLGQAYHVVGQLSDAINRLEQALKFADKLQDLEQRACIYAALGNCFYALEQPQKALNYHEESLRIALQFQDHKLEMGLYGCLANDHEALGNVTQMLNCSQKQLDKALQMNDVINIGKAYLGLGMCYRSLKEYDKAREYYDISLKIFICKKSFSNEAKTYRNWGILCHDLKEYEEALCFHLKDLEIALRLGRLEEKAAAYHNLAKNYYDLGDDEKARKCFSLAIQATTPLQQNLEKSEWKITRFEKWFQAYAGLESARLCQNQPVEALKISDAKRSQALSSLIYKKLLLQNNTAPSLAPLREAEMRQLAEKLKTTFVIYSLAKAHPHCKIFIWTVTSLQINHAVTQMSLEEFDEIHAVLQRAPYQDKKRLRPQRGERVEDPFKKCLSRWYELFIAPVEPYLLPWHEEKTLTFIPHHFLAHLPFGAFYDVKTTSYLIEKTAVTVAPSLKVISLLDQLPSHPLDQSVVIGCPTTPVERSNNLPYSLTEVRDVVAPVLKTFSEHIFTHEQATAENMIKQAPLARWIHIASHGVMEEDLNEQQELLFKGFFKLAKDQTHPSGHLGSIEIASLSLKADLVFMSACHLGRGNLKQEGSVGPIWSFLGAGAKSVVASYWPVADSPATLQIIQTFYDSLLGVKAPKVTKAHALRKAILMAMEKNRGASHQWASFFLSGLTE
ncbi:MAG: CHAT domain-containing protein [Candidatus Rhabdochlamydia sp.]